MSAVQALFGAWILLGAVFIEFYARRYESLGMPLFPDGALVILAIALVAAPRRLRERFPLLRDAARKVVTVLLCGIAIALAARHPLQLGHVMIVAALPGATLLALAPVLCRPRATGAARVLVSAALALLMFALLAYYGVLVVGLESWQEIVTREQIATYALYVPELASALPFSPWLAWAGVGAALGALLFAYGLASRALAREAGDALRRLGAWLAPGGAPHARRWAGAAVVVLAYPLLAHATYQLNYRSDPLLTTFFGTQLPRGTPAMPFWPDPSLDALERQAASRYAAPAQVASRTLVLVIVDALRADQMSVYGHPRNNTPFLSRLHREGRLARFENAFAICTATPCGVLGILNSRYWGALGRGQERFGLTEVLKRVGYSTHFVLGGNHRSHYGLRSFYGKSIDSYFDGGDAERYMNDDADVMAALRRLPLPAGAPAFLYVHLISAHQVGRREPRHDLWRGVSPDADDESCCTTRQFVVNRYHHGIRQADARIEELFAILEEKGRLGDALVVITADHGERLGDGGGPMGHGGPPVDGAVRVPLLLYDAQSFRYPARPLTSVVDIAPTLLERIGAPIPEHWSGMSLAKPAPARFVMAQSREEFMVIGEFGGDLLKYYRRPGEESGRLVRLARAGDEEAISVGPRTAAMVAELRQALEVLTRAPQPRGAAAPAQ